MATVSYALDDTAPGHVITATWVLGNADSGVAIQAPDAADRSIQLFGTFGSATVVVEGSNEIVPTTYATLNDAAGNALSKTSAGVFFVAEDVRWLRVRSSGGSGSAITCILLARSIR